MDYSKNFDENSAKESEKYPSKSDNKKGIKSVLNKLESRVQKCFPFINTRRRFIIFVLIQFIFLIVLILTIILLLIYGLSNFVLEIEYFNYVIRVLN